MKGWYLDHSGVAVKTQNHLLLFDLFGDILNWEQGGGLGEGRLNPEQIAGEDVLIFVSHEHEDHFDPKIFELKKHLKKVRYVLPEEFDEVIDDAVFVHSNMSVQLDDCKITTFDSTDIGVAYLVEIDGKLIYHAGDLNWWHWEGEEEEFNLDQQRRYQQQMKLLSREVGKREIDLAFVPVDPRLEDDCLRGVTCFAQNVNAKAIVPIHFWGDPSVFDRIQTAEQARFFADKIVCLHQRGDSF